MSDSPAHYLVVNASASRARDATFWRRRLSEVGISTRPWQGKPASGHAKLNRNDRLLVAGGDGTVRRYAPLCMATGATLGVLPSGTGNDFARTLGVPIDPPEACRVIAGGRMREVDVGRLGGEIFLNVAHVGAGSGVAHDVDDASKRWWGRLSYLGAVVDQARRQRGFRATITCDGRRFHGRWLEIAIANGSSFGGGQRVFEADPGDGLLDVVAVRPRPLRELTLLWLWTLLHRSLPRHDALLVRRSDSCEIDAPHLHAVAADGESLGTVPGRFTLLPHALRVLVDKSTMTGLDHEPAAKS